MTTTEDLAVARARSRRRQGRRSTSLAKGYQDPHFVDPKPSFILKLSRADLLIVVGRELEIGWLPPLITSSRNAKIQPGATAISTRRERCSILEIPTGQITRAMGDVHPHGNPHYWLDRATAAASRRRSRQAERSSRRPTSAYFDAALRRLRQAGSPQAEKRWDAAMAPYKGTKIVTYHRSWPNFMERFGLEVIGYVEPKPGIPPSPSHTLELIDEMKRQGVKLIVVEPYFDLKTPQAIANADRRQGARAGAVGRRRQGGDRLHRAVRLRRQPAGRARSSR